MNDFLFELGVEEVPVSYIRDINIQLKKNFISALDDNLIDYENIDTASTNRRFIISFHNIESFAKNRTEQIKGPSKKIAYDDNNNPTIALKKFMEVNDVSDTELIEIETKKGLYLAVNKEFKGEDTIELLKKIIPEILGKLSFEKTMLWNSSRVSFVRPVRNLLALFNSEVIEFEFAGVSSSNTTFGHQLLSEGNIIVSSFKDYCELLNKNFVIFRIEDRKQKILDEIKEIEEELKIKANIQPNMLEYFIFNNEYPVVFSGTFDKKYLELPSEIISTFMINEKKLIPIFNNFGNLSNNFIGISNIPDENNFVSNGNSKVIKATFEDAKFFWDHDRKDDFFSLRENLKNVMFQKDLGTFYEKSDRLKKLTALITDLSGNTHLSDSLQKAAELCKNDLTTRMVREFPSLQGIMGGLYLKEMDLEDDVWNSVYHHYEPKGFVENELENLGGGILSIADKIDNITAFISKGIKISSSKDPYGIRRDASSIIKIILDFKMDFDLKTLLDFSIKNYSTKKAKKKDLYEKIKNMFIGRMKFFLKDILFLRLDIVNSVVNPEQLFVYKTYLKAKSISEMLKTSNIEHLIILHKRLKNIVKDSQPYMVSEELLEDEPEKILFEIFNESKEEIENLILKDDYIQACSKIAEMKPVVDSFFDNVMVMSKDKKLRNNRLALLQKINDILSKVADFSVLKDIS